MLLGYISLLSVGKLRKFHSVFQTVLMEGSDLDERLKDHVLTLYLQVQEKVCLHVLPLSPSSPCCLWGYCLLSS